MSVPVMWKRLSLGDRQRTAKEQRKRRYQRTQEMYSPVGNWYRRIIWSGCQFEGAVARKYLTVLSLETGEIGDEGDVVR